MRDFAVVLTHNRPMLLDMCLEKIGPQVDLAVVVDNASNPPTVPTLTWPENVHLIHDPLQPPNLAYLWNRALDLIRDEFATEPEWNVAMLCDDSMVPEGWFETVVAAMRAQGADAASTYSYAVITESYLLRSLSNGPERMCPWGFVLPGERGLRADQSLLWWYHQL